MMRGRLTASVLAGLALAGCIDLSTSTNELSAIEFGALPYPALVVGDSLRDSTGAARKLEAKLLDGAGNVISGTPIAFIALDSLLTVTTSGYAIAKNTAGTASLVAAGGGLQSIKRTIDVVARPDTFAAEKSPDTLRLVIPDNATSNLTGEFRVKLLSKASPGTGTKSWIVRYVLSYQGRTIAPGDTSLVYLVNEAGRPSVSDTSDAAGAVSRKVRFKVVPGQLPALDSIIVTASASYRGSLVPGAPARMVVPVKPK